MRIKRLEFKNINSFTKKEVIDFDRLGRLFLISGPTGSGKTTIVDAILAALYDKTPRLSNSKHLLNKDAKEGYIVLEFDEYKIEWRAKRRREDIEIKRLLFRGDELIADKKSEIKKEILAIIKLDFHQFTKSVVLAQGEFDAFLKANSKEKMKVLEKLLGVEEFERISKKVYERTKELLEKKERIKDEMSKLREFDEKKEALLADKKEEVEGIESELGELKRKNELLKEKSNLVAKKEEIKSRLKEKSEIIKELKEAKEKEKRLFKRRGEVEERLSEIEAEVIKEVRLNELKRALEESLGDELVEKKEELKKEVEELEKKRYYVKGELEKIQKELSKKAFQNTEKIKEINSKIEELRKEYITKSKEAKRIESEILKTEEEIKRSEREFLELEERLRYLEAKSLVIRYESERGLLRDGEPCPLCGSLEHPYAKNPPKVDKLVKEEYEKALGVMERFERELEKKRMKLSRLRGELGLVLRELDRIKKEGVKLKEELEAFGVLDVLEFVRLSDELKAKKELFEKELLSVEKELSLKDKRLLELDKEIKSADRKKEKLLREIKSIKLKIQNPKEQKELLQEELEKITKELEALKNTIQKLLTKEALLEKDQKELLEIKRRIGGINVKEEDYEDRIRELESKKEVLNQEIGYLQRELDEMMEDLREYKKLQKELNSLNKELRIFEKLNKKIGSKGGDAFKKIAINYLIDSLLFLANEILDTLSDGRYLLEKSEKMGDLELFVIDKFYANSKREVATLSGGEKFLVSLALSFGLSNMVKDSIKIENMFLDEGFGSLDEKSLNKALDMILRVAGERQIGIISHIEKLKEEIDSKIVVKNQRGKSYLLI